MEINASKLKWIYLGGIFFILALPLLNLPPWFSPPDWGKTIVFRIILSILVFVFLWQIFSKKQFEVKTSLPFWLLILLLGSFLLATVFSLDIGFSFWGSPYRSGGFINFAFYIIFAILAFLILKKSDWQKIWNFSIIIGVLVSLIAIFQQFGLISNILIPFSGRPPSTIGGSIFLGVYLLLLSFLTITFGILEKDFKKKLFYFFTALLFLFIIFITGSRAAYIGLFIGILYFILFFPKKIMWLKLGLGVFIFLGIFGVYYLNTHNLEIIYNPYLLKHPALSGLLQRFTVNSVTEDPRYSSWQIALNALKEKPLLGYGPENFSIGFDKYYDPSLPYITKDWGSWWDRAHNFIFDIGVTAGIPTLIIYLSLFGSLFFSLQRLKKDKLEDSMIPHGIQATFLAYFGAIFFSFDVFSTYLISFLLIGYSLYLISLNKNGKIFTLEKISKYRYLIILPLFLLLIWFIWSFNLKPLQINKEINLAAYLSKNGDCENALTKMEGILLGKTYLNNYLRLKYVEVIDECIKEKPEMTNVLAPKAVEVLKENIKTTPYYTRNWISLGDYTNILIEVGGQDLKGEADFYFQKAYELSPKRQEIFTRWATTKLITGDYPGAKEKAQVCIDLNPTLGDCWWLKGLSEIYLGENIKAKEDMETAEKKSYPISSKEALVQLAKVYANLKNYNDLTVVYKKLINLEPSNVQYRASLAFIYKEMGEYEKARKEALGILEIMPDAKGDVDKFLEGLPY